MGNQDWAKANLQPNEYSAWMQIQTGNIELAQAILKSGAFGAQISDGDRKSAEKAAIDISTSPALGFYNTKNQQLYNFDLNRAKLAWAGTQSFATTAALESAWNRQVSQLSQRYIDVSDERNAFIKANSTGSTVSPGMVRKAYELYPSPTFNPSLNNGAGGFDDPVRARRLARQLRGQ